MSVQLHAPRPPRSPLVERGHVEHHDADMSATADAHVTLDHLQAKLAIRGQWLPVDGHGRETLAELVLRNSTGPLRLGHGGWRDLLLGAQFTDGRGRLVTAGGRTVKNVAGYDLTKLLVGSLGAFGKPVTLTFRTHKRPAAAVIAAFPSVQGIVNDLLPTDLRPTWMALSDDGLAAAYQGGERVVRHFRETLRQVKHPRPHSVTSVPIERDIEIRADLWRPGDFRLSIPPAQVMEAMRELRPRRWVADPVHGIVIGDAPTAEQQDAVDRLARKLGGTAWLWDGRGKVRHLSFDPPTADLVARLKAEFDPDGKLPPLPVRKM